VLSNTNAGISPAYTITGGALSGISEYAVVACNAFYSTSALAGDTVLRGTGRLILASGISGNAAANYIPGIMISNTLVTLGSTLSMGTAWTGGSTNTLWGDCNGGGKYIQWAYNNTPGTLIFDNSSISLSATADTLIRIGPRQNVGSAADTTTYGLERSRHQIQFAGYRDAQIDKIGSKIVSINKQTYGGSLQQLIQSADLIFCTSPPGYGNIDDTVEHLRITDVGNIGINCNAPSVPLDITGQTRIYEATGTGTVAGTANTQPTTGIPLSAGTLTLRHGNANGQSSIVFPSAQNYGSDYGYITYMDDVSNVSGSERGRLLIGVENDLIGAATQNPQDALVLMPFGGRVGIGQMNPAYILDVSGTVRITGQLTMSSLIDMSGCNISNVNTISAYYVIGTTGNTFISSVSPLAAVNGDDTNSNRPQIEFQFKTGGYKHYIGSRHYGGLTSSASNAIDFWLYSSTGGSTASTFPGTGNVNAMTVTAGGVGINQSNPIGTLHVKTSSGTPAYTGWDSKWMIVTSASNSGTTANTPALGLGYGGNTAYITSLEPQVSWRNLEIGGSNIYLITTGGGNVGIDCNAPQVKLDVNGIVGISGNPGNGHLILFNSTKSVIFRNDSNTFYFLIGSSLTSSWNSLRPFSFNLTSGDVSMAHNLTLSGNLYTCNIYAVSGNNLNLNGNGCNIGITGSTISIAGNVDGNTYKLGQFSNIYTNSTDLTLSANYGHNLVLQGTLINAQTTLNMSGCNISNVCNIIGNGGTVTLSNSYDINILCGHNIYTYTNAGSYNGIYSCNGGIGLRPDQNVYIYGGSNAINLQSFTLVQHDGSIYDGLGLQVYNTASNGVPATPTSRYGSIWVSGNAHYTNAESGNSLVLDVGGYGGNIFGGILQSNYGFLSLGTISGGASNTERIRIIGTSGNVGINTTTPVTTLDVNGGLTVRNGIRPPFSNVSASNITTDPYSYGTYYYITGALSTITVGAPLSTADSNAFWLFRNATSSYQYVTVTWPTIGGTAPSPSTDSFSIAPMNSMSIMYTPAVGDYGYYSNVFNWAIF